MDLKRSGLGMAAVMLASVLGARTADGQTFMALGEVAYVDYAGMAPGGAYHAPGDDETYLQVSIGERRLRVLKGAEVLHEFPVAVGKGAYLRHRDAQNGGWLFETPVGVFSVGRKETDPVWYAPDWHFIEKGLPVPASDSTRMWREIAGCEMANGSASSLTVASPSASRARIPRRVGSARAAKVRSSDSAACTHDNE